MLDYDLNARAPNSAWLIVLCGALFALLMLANATARAETERPWTTTAACAGQPYSCGNSVAEWRAPPGLVMTAASMSADYYAGRWVDWDSLADDAPVYACGQDRAEGNAANCDPNERYIPKSQVFGYTAPEPPPVTYPPTVDITANGASAASILLGESATIEWSTKGGLGCVSSWGGLVEPQGSMVVTPAVGAHLYQLTCSYSGLATQSSTHVIVTEPAPRPPWKCQPDIVSARTGVAADGGVCAVGWCLTPDGWFGTSYCGKPDIAADLAPIIAQVMAIGEADEPLFRANAQREQTPAEKAKVVAIELAYGPKYRVQPITNATPPDTRPIYTQNADGTRGAQLRINGVPQRIAVDASCNPYKRITSTAYYSVAGEQSTTAQVIVEGWAQCNRR